MNYIRTAEAVLALENRDRILSAKQRQLLILIGSKDFKKLSDDAKEAMCSSDIFNSLIHLGFLRKDAPLKQDPLHDHLELTAPESEIKTTQSQQSELPKVVPVPTESNIVTSATVPLTTEALTSPPSELIQEPSYTEYQDIELTFDNMKTLLTKTLNQHCGLMGKTHARKIEAAQTVAELKRSHMTVITLLQESRMSQAELLQLTKALQRFYQHAL